MSQAKEISLLLNDYDVCKTLSDIVPFPYAEKDAQDFISVVIADGSAVKSETILVDGEIAGVAGYQVGGCNKHHVAEAGYWLGKKYWGKGIATVAMAAVLKKAFEDASIQKVQASAFAFNVASVRVMEKNGLTREGFLRSGLEKEGKLYDEVLYGITREEFNKIYTE